MLEPQKNWQGEVNDAEAGRVGEMNTEALAVIAGLSAYTVKQYKLLLTTGNKAIYKRIERKLIREYGALFGLYKKLIINSYNQSKIETIYLATQTLGREPRLRAWKPAKRLPTNNDFRITNRILSEKSVTIRTNKMARRVTKIIRSSVDKGRSIERTTALIEREFGLRDKTARKLTPKAKRLLKSGKYAMTNGHFYTFYRIARTESMRMADIRQNEVYEELKTREPDARLKLIAKLDGRTRQQSRDMNGQVADRKGRFLYPDGRRYFKGKAPARYSINDRETTITVFIDQGARGDIKFKSLQSFKRATNN